MLTAEAFETAIRTYDEAEQRAAQFDWGGEELGGAVSDVHSNPVPKNSGPSHIPADPALRQYKLSQDAKSIATC